MKKKSFMKRIKIFVRENFFCKFCKHKDNLDTCWNCIVNEQRLYELNDSITILKSLLIYLQDKLEDIAWRE